MPDQSSSGDQEREAPDQDLLYTNPLLSNDAQSDGVRAVLALLTHLDLNDSALGNEGSYGLILIHEWLRRSMAYADHKNRLPR
ncbi:MAG: hypothetical protein COB33_014615 [Thiotrichaceae bacterium]|nr:hypothetical protein [Thiotrichaceae bacterium]PCI13089.1 MAG: hypothetical protein COB71_06975 [Thiotrichales bacterium]